ncbi:hypothetical protein Ahy_A03g010625 [Arachis hypogaea]|uniref:Uncharacterized protein n=1 Tax=Arachis hypogaea TaxID=3818 RepID=A0A445DMZ0_ARAHY|nr:hypothetical protein Ahy_A03g010625 [Arachis hypogaea]
MQEKCYLWATYVKTYKDGGTNEYEPVCFLNAQQTLQLSKIHFASLKASTYIEAEGYVIFRMMTEVDHFRVEYASRILFHEMNRDRDTAIRKSEAIRLSKSSAVLLSPYCQIDSDDIDND